MSRSLLLIWARNGAGTFEPVLAVITVIRGRGGNGFFYIWSQELVTSTIATIGIVCCGVSTIWTAAVVLAKFLRHSVVPAAMLHSLSFQIAHVIR